MDGLWATKIKDIGLIVPAISFHDFWLNVIPIHHRYRQMDGQTTCSLDTTLCTIVHRTVKMIDIRLWAIPFLNILGYCVSVILNSYMWTVSIGNVQFLFHKLFLEALRYHWDSFTMSSRPWYDVWAILNVSVSDGDFNCELCFSRVNK